MEPKFNEEQFVNIEYVMTLKQSTMDLIDENIHHADDVLLNDRTIANPEQYKIGKMAEAACQNYFRHVIGMTVYNEISFTDRSVADIKTKEIGNLSIKSRAPKLFVYDDVSQRVKDNTYIETFIGGNSWMIKEKDLNPWISFQILCISDVPKRQVTIKYAVATDVAKDIVVHPCKAFKKQRKYNMYFLLEEELFNYTSEDVTL